MKRKFVKKTEHLINKFPIFIRNFNLDKKVPGLYFYKKTISQIENNNNLRDLLKNKDFIELIYATLVSWDMNSRGARMKYFDGFFENILNCRDAFLDLSKFKLEKISENNLQKVKLKLKYLYQRLELMNSGGRLVSNSKIMHFILPNLVMPMDRQNTLMFFYGNTNESPNKFLEIFECSWCVAKRRDDLTKYLDNDWNRTIPKIIDNAIIGIKAK